MHVKIVASSTLHLEALRESGYTPQSDIVPTPADDASEKEWDDWEDSYFGTQDIDELHEAAGRGCYQSWDRPNPATATNKGYLGNIIDVEHESVLGHGYVTFFVKGVTRALLLELERHAEHMNINLSVISQRYVNHGTPEHGSPVHPPLFNECLNKKLEEHAGLSRVLYNTAVDQLMAEGKTRKEARGAARAFLPEATETKLFVSGTIRAWRDIIRKRAIDGADIEIRLFAIEVLKELVRVAPNSVQDFAKLHGIEGEK